jgi:hypothetical protein
LFDHTITTLVLPDIEVDGRRVIVQDFALTLTDRNIGQIEYFLSDPIGFITTNHPETRVYYPDE